MNNISKSTALKVSVFGVVLVRIFPHSDWIRRDLRISLYSVQIWENTDQNNSEYGHFLRSVREAVKVREDLELPLPPLFVRFCDSWMWCEKKNQIEKVMVFMFVLLPTQNVFKVITNNFSRYWYFSYEKAIFWLMIAYYVFLTFV